MYHFGTLHKLLLTTQHYEDSDKMLKFPFQRSQEKFKEFTLFSTQGLSDVLSQVVTRPLSMEYTGKAEISENML